MKRAQRIAQGLGWFFCIATLLILGLNMIEILPGGGWNFLSCGTLLFAVLSFFTWSCLKRKGV